MNNLGDSFPLIFFFVCCFIIIVPFTVLVIFLILKSRGEAWSGVIIKKVYNTIEDDDGREQDNYYFEVKMDNGTRNRNVGVSKQLFSEAKEGDRIKKDKGKLIPEIY